MDTNRTHIRHENNNGGRQKDVRTKDYRYTEVDQNNGEQVSNNKSKTDTEE